MSYLINNQQKLNDIIFANRNKNYGAYAIRSSYGNTMLKSLSCVVGGLGALISIAYYVSHKPMPQQDLSGQILDEKIYTIPVDLEKEKKPEPRPAEKPAPKEPGNKTSALTSNPVVNDTVETVAAMEIKTSGQQSVSGTGIANVEPGNGTGSPDTAGTGGSNIVSTVKSNFEVDAMPEFEGGLSALYKFLLSRLRYPERAMDAGVQGTVFVKFVVDEKGRVGNLSLLNNLGYGLDDEARRVVSMIPNFKSPAKVKGEPVKVYYQLPIRFQYK